MALKGFKDQMEKQVLKAVKDTSKKETIVKGTKKAVGMGLLNPLSLQEKRVEENPLIDIEELIPNEKNKYEIRNIEELMESIRDVGVRQPLEAFENKDGKYLLTTGHRRLEACKRLVEEGDDQFKRVPVKIFSLDDINLPLSDDLKEKYLITTTNVEMRTDRTPAERLMEIKTMQEIYKALNDAGVKISGKRRDLIAKDLGISTQSVARLTNIDKNVTEEVRKEFESGTLDLTTTASLVKEEPEVQNKTLKKAKEKVNGVKKITKDMIEKAKEEVKMESDEEVVIQEEFDTLVTKLKDIKNLFEEIEGKEVSSTTYRYLKTGSTKLIKMLDEINALLH